MSDDVDLLDDFLPSEETLPTKAAETDDDSLDDFLPQVDLSRGLTKPWMKFHKFVLVKTVDEVREIVDKALAHGRCGLDLETEGFDNRIDYDAEGHPSTRHKIVGYCISVRGAGYYIPVRHRFNKTYGEKDPNVPLEGVDAEIRRLCEASQPILTEEGFREDPLGSAKIETPPRVRVYFWNAKFDQEFLYPVTGIEVWHPASFEDGMLAAYAYYSDDFIGLKDKAAKNLSITDPDTGAVYPYEMIEFTELFASNVPNKKRFFYDLYPEEGSAEVLYGSSDAICTEILCEAQATEWDLTQPNLKYTYVNVLDKMKSVGGDFTYALEKQVVQAIRDMERNRVRIDKAAIDELLAEAKTELEKYHNLIVELAKGKGFDEFNPGSSKQLSEFLFDKKGLDITPKPAMNEASKQYKTDAKTLEEMADRENAPEVLRWIVIYRQIDKIIGTYLDSMAANCDENDQLRFKFHQTGAATGRFTAPAGEADHGYAGVPPQGIPGKEDPKKPKVAHSLRRTFIGRPGYTIVKCDYSGQELRIVTNLTDEPKWVNEFLTARAEGREADLHTLTAQAFFGPHITKEHKLERGMGKTANFALIYGGGTAAVQRATGCDKMEAARRKANFDKSVPVFAGWVKAQHERVKKNLGIRNPFKRFISIPDANLKFGDKNEKGESIPVDDIKKIRAACERKSTNYPVQSAGADILKISLVRLLKEFHRRGWRKNGGDDSVRMIMTVHDEVVFEIRHDRVFEAIPIIVEIMESPSKMAKWKVPLVVEPDLGLSWNAKYAWPDVISGKKVPEWLLPYLPGSGSGSAPPIPEGAASNPTPTHQVAKQQNTPRVESMKPTSLKGTVKVATFTLARAYLREEMVNKVYGVMSESLDPSSNIYLRLVDNSGEIIVDAGDRYPIDAEGFRIRFKDRCLGFDQYEVRDIPV